jgi:hypothetical protein
LRECPLAGVGIEQDERFSHRSDDSHCSWV